MDSTFFSVAGKINLVLFAMILQLCTGVQVHVNLIHPLLFSFVETSPDIPFERDGTTSGGKRPRSFSDTFRSKTADNGHGNMNVSGKGKNTVRTHTKSTPTKSREESSSSEASLPSPANVRDGNRHKQVNGGRESRDKDIHVAVCDKQANDRSHKAFTAKHYSGKDGPVVTTLSSDMEDTESQQECTPCGGTSVSATRSKSKVTYSHFSCNSCRRWVLFVMQGFAKGFCLIGREMILMVSASLWMEI